MCGMQTKDVGAAFLLPSLYITALEVAEYSQPMLAELDPRRLCFS